MKTLAKLVRIGIGLHLLAWISGAPHAATLLARWDFDGLIDQRALDAETLPAAAIEADYVATAVHDAAPPEPAEWEGTDDFSSGLSAANWQASQRYVGAMTVVGANGHASFLVPVSALSEQNAFIVWRGTPTATEDWSVEITGHNTAFHGENDCTLQLAALNTEAFASGRVEALVVSMQNDTDNDSGPSEVGTSWWHYPGGYATRVRSAIPSTDFRLRLVYDSASQTIEAWYSPAVSGSSWTFLDSMTRTEMSPGMAATNTFSFAILANTDYGPIAEGEMWVDDFRLSRDTGFLISPGAYAFTNYVGMPAVAGTGDGVGTAARFSGPAHPALDLEGHLYVADIFNHTIRKIAAGGSVTTLAGMAGVPGSSDGGPGTAKFNQPHGVGVDPGGNVLVADWGNHTIRKITPDGFVTTLVGSAGQPGWVDGTGSAARLNMPECVAVDGHGNIFVAERDNFVIRRITPAGTVTTVAGSPGSRGWADGMGSAARFNDPSGIAVDGVGNVFVGDRGNDAIRKVTPSGTVTTLAGSPGNRGWADGVGSAARFNRPSGVAVDDLGNVFVTEEGNHTIRKVTPLGEVSTLGGLPGITGTSDGIGSEARFNVPAGPAVDAAGVLYVADALNYRISRGLPPVLRFLPPVVADGLLQLQLTGPPGASVVLQGSSNLREWTPVATNAFSSVGNLPLSLPITPGGRQFYRALFGP